MPWYGAQPRERRPGVGLDDMETMRQNKYALTPQQFQALRQKLEKRSGSEKFDADNVEAAFAVMVGGESVTKAADGANCSRQNLHRVLRDLMAIFNDVEPPSRVVQRQKALKPRTPASWVRVAVTVPPELAKAVLEMESKARAQLEHSRDSEKD